MKRRQLLGYAAGTATLALLKPAAAEGYVHFTADVYEQELASGNPFVLGFLSSWGPVCRVQERTVSALINSKPEYSEIKFIRADWDEFGRSELTKQLKIPRRSTLLMYRGGEEVARVIAQTNKDVIEELFVAALQ